MADGIRSRTCAEQRADRRQPECIVLGIVLQGMFERGQRVGSNAVDRHVVACQHLYGFALLGLLGGFAQGSCSGFDLRRGQAQQRPEQCRVGDAEFERASQ